MSASAAPELLPDLDSREQVERFVDAFYARMLRDPDLAPIFLDVADIDLEVHLPHIKAYWSKLLLGEREYRRHTMNIHRKVHQQRPFTAADFQRWLTLFTGTLDSGWTGPLTERARRVATSIAGNMEAGL